MSVASAEGPPQNADPKDAGVQPASAAAEKSAQVPAPGAGVEGPQGAAPRQDGDEAFCGVAVPGKYVVLSRANSLWASEGANNRSKDVPGFQTVYWHTKIARRREPDLFLSPGVRILLSSGGSALYMAAVTLSGLAAQLLVCGDDHGNVQLLPVTSCTGVVKLTGELDDRWVRAAVEVFGQQQLEREREAESAGGATGRPPGAGQSRGRGSEVAKLSLSNDPAVIKTLQPVGPRKERHKAVGAPSSGVEEAPVRKRAKKGGKRPRKGGGARRTAEEDRDTATQSDVLEPEKETGAAGAGAEAAALEQVRQVGQELAQVLHGANIGKVEFHFNIYPK